jgi:hypothetical protein
MDVKVIERSFKREAFGDEKPSPEIRIGVEQGRKVDQVLDNGFLDDPKEAGFRISKYF